MNRSNESLYSFSFHKQLPLIYSYRYFLSIWDRGPPLLYPIRQISAYCFSVGERGKDEKIKQKKNKKNEKESS